MPFYLKLVNKSPLKLLFLHVLFGFLASQDSNFSTIWGWSIVVFGSYNIIKYRNRFNDAAFFAIYLVGIEVLLRMTDARVLWEFGKYGSILMLMLGIIMQKLTKHRTSIYIVIYILTFLPSVFLVPFESFDFWRQSISFNLSGPILLFLSFIYFRNRIITKNEIINIFRVFILPMVSMSIVLLVRIPKLEEIVFTSEANFQMSGGYGPNQVSSILGLMIAIISLSKIIGIILFNKNVYDYIILSVCSIQAYLTFARGGVITAIIAIFTSWFISSFINSNTKIIKTGRIIYIILMLSILWSIAGDFSEGMMEKRYAAMIKLDQNGELGASGRILIMALDLEIFKDNYFTGVGPGMANKLRMDYGYQNPVASHSEFTRALAEHGFFGMIGILTLLVLVIKEFSYRGSIEKCILSCFAMISILTMSHSAMRLAMAGLIFGMSFIRYNPSISEN
tara:strand:+ start:1337 stop:2686 length:1350 start_codon:yes stop_codon:yes gene_type:complete